MAAGAAALGAAAIGIYGASQEQQEYEKQADNLMADAKAKERLMAEDNRKFLADQEMAYLKSGVILEGSPLLVLEETRKRGLDERLSMRKGAFNQAESLRAAGRNRMISALGMGMVQGTQAMGGMMGNSGGQTGYTAGKPATSQRAGTQFAVGGGY